MACAENGMLGEAVPRRPPFRCVSSELALIEAIRRRAASGSKTRGLRLGIGDDCAVLRPSPGHEVVVTTDFSLEGRHFRRDWHPPQSAGHRCLARGLSDLAAMGAEPLAVFLSLAVPARLPAAWLDGFLEGLLALADRYKVPLAGGDTSESPTPGPHQQGTIAMDIVAVGQVKRGQALLRSGARPGDAIYVTGALGGAAAEFSALAGHPGKFRQLNRFEAGHPHFYPEPRLTQGRRLRRLATAAIDLSDGLSTDLTHLCESSELAAELDEAAIPVHPLAIQAEASGLVPSALQLALNGGEDYELLFTARATSRIPPSLAGIPVHRIGTMQPFRCGQSVVRMRASDGKMLAVSPGGWEHFR